MVALARARAPARAPQRRAPPAAPRQPMPAGRRAPPRPNRALSRRRCRWGPWTSGRARPPLGQERKPG
eukprot:6805157-Lingulodinium_polyedra.AAC.1